MLGLVRLVLMATLALVMVGCSVFQGDGLSALPTYAALGRTVLQSELAIDLTTLTPEEIQERKQIMEVVVPITADLNGLAVDYLDLLNAASTSPVVRLDPDWRANVAAALETTG